VVSGEIKVTAINGGIGVGVFYQATEHQRGVNISGISHQMGVVAIHIVINGVISGVEKHQRHLTTMAVVAYRW